MKPQEKPERATFASSFRFFSKPSSRKPFCLNFSLCHNDDVNNIDLFEPERKKSSQETIIAQHYSSFMKKSDSFSENIEKIKSTSEKKLEIILEKKKNLKKELYLLKNNQRLIIAKIVVKNFNLKNKSLIKTMDKITKISYETSSKPSLFHQEIVKNLAKKIKKNSMNLIIDLSPNDNVSLAAFAKEELFSIGIDEKHMESIRFKKILGVNRYVELLEARFHELKRISADLLYISFMEKNEFSLLQELTREKLEVWLKNIENLAILLPKNCDISELAIVFHDFFELNKREEDLRSILIEVLKERDEIEGYMIFYGPITGISGSQEFAFIKEYITQDLTEDFLEKNDDIIDLILKKLGLKIICKLLNYCEETLSCENELLFEKFLHYAKNFNFLEQNDELLLKTNIFSKETARKNIISLDFNDEKQKSGQKLIISNEKTTNFSDCDNKESIIGSLVPIKDSYFDKEKALNSSYSQQGNSLGFWTKGSENEGSWSEKD